MLNRGIMAAIINHALHFFSIPAGGMACHRIAVSTIKSGFALSYLGGLNAVKTFVSDLGNGSIKF